MELSKQEMELFKQEMELFHPLPDLWSENLFYKMFLIHSVYTPKPPLVHLNVCYQFAVESVLQFILDSYVLRDSVNLRLDA